MQRYCGQFLDVCAGERGDDGKARETKHNPQADLQLFFFDFAIATFRPLYAVQQSVDIEFDPNDLQPPPGRVKRRPPFECLNYKNAPKHEGHCAV